MKTIFASLALTLASLPFAAQASQIVNIAALSATGTSVSLAAGNYQISVIGTSQGGLYNGWDFATQNFGTASATPAPNDWVDSFTINANGASNSYVAAGNPGASSDLGALANYQTSVLYINGVPPSSLTPNTALLTLTSSQSVNFTVADYLFVDNWGGESLKITAVPASATPEPSTFGMIGLALVGAAAGLRKKFAK